MKTYTTFRAYKFRAYPTQSYKERMDEVLELCRELYNAGLEEKIDAYRREGKYISLYDQQKSLTQIRADDERYRNVSVWFARGALARLDKAFKGFFNRVKRGGKAGFPRFKSKGRYSTLSIDSRCGFQIKNNLLCVKGMERLRFNRHREIEGEVKTAKIVKSFSGKYYVVFMCKQEKEIKYASGDVVGIDLGIRKFAVASDGTIIDNPKILDKHKNRLETKDKILSKKRMGSKRRRKAKLARAKAYEKVKNARKDFHHKIANRILSSYGEIYMEDLNVAKMKEEGWRRLNRNIDDMGWAEFLNIMEYKAEEAGVSFHKINPRNTSKRCSQCYYVNDSFTGETFTCKECGYKEDRDLNASYNILQIGLGTGSAFAEARNN